MRRYSRVDCSACSFLAICDRCAWRDGPWTTQTRADQAMTRHLLAEHPATAWKQRERASV